MKKNKHTPLLILICSLALLTQCTQVQDVKAFGSAARSVSESASAGYKNFNDQYNTTINRGDLVIGDKIQFDNLDRKLDKNGALAVRLQVMGKMADYATALEALATRDVSAEVKTAATNLTTSLKEANKLLKTSAFAEKDISTIGGAVAAVADVYVEYKREHALRKIILAGDAGVQKITDILQGEFGVLGTSLSTQSTLAALKYINYINDHPDNLALRLELLNEAQKLHDVARDAPGAFKAVEKAAAAMGKSHAKLAEAARHNHRLNNQEAMSAIGDFVAKAQEVKKLFDAVRQS